MYSLPGVELGGCKDCQFQIHCIVLKWENRFTLGLNAAKITNYIKKLFK